MFRNFQQFGRCVSCRLLTQVDVGSATVQVFCLHKAVLRHERRHAKPLLKGTTETVATTFDALLLVSRASREQLQVALNGCHLQVSEAARDVS
jgi:hypothetical protein